MTIEREFMIRVKKKEVKLELVSHEVEKFIWLMLKGSGTVLENLYSPIQIIGEEGSGLQVIIAALQEM